MDVQSCLLLVICLLEQYGCFSDAVYYSEATADGAIGILRRGATLARRVCRCEGRAVFFTTRLRDVTSSLLF